MMWGWRRLRREGRRKPTAPGRLCTPNHFRFRRRAGSAKRVQSCVELIGHLSKARADLMVPIMPGMLYSIADNTLQGPWRPSSRLNGFGVT